MQLSEEIVNILFKIIILSSANISKLFFKFSISEVLNSILISLTFIFNEEIKSIFLENFLSHPIILKFSFNFNLNISKISTNKDIGYIPPSSIEPPSRFLLKILFL